MSKETLTEGTVSLNFEISANLSTEIRMAQLNLKRKGIEMNLVDMYPEIMELGLPGFKKKYKI